MPSFPALLLAILAGGAVTVVQGQQAQVGIAILPTNDGKFGPASTGNCTVVPKVAYGTFVGCTVPAVIGAVCTASCSKNQWATYASLQPVTAVCTKAGWVLEQHASCQRVCTSPPDIALLNEQGVWPEECNTTLAEQACTAQCFHTGGSASVKCKADGRWAAQVSGSCQPPAAAAPAEVPAESLPNSTYPKTSPKAGNSSDGRYHVDKPNNGTAGNGTADGGNGDDAYHDGDGGDDGHNGDSAEGHSHKYSARHSRHNKHDHSHHGHSQHDHSSRHGHDHSSKHDHDSKHDSKHASRHARHQHQKGSNGDNDDDNYDQHGGGAPAASASSYTGGGPSKTSPGDKGHAYDKPATSIQADSSSSIPLGVPVVEVMSTQAQVPVEALSLMMIGEEGTAPITATTAAKATAAAAAAAAHGQQQ